MTGKELISWIKENHAENHRVMVLTDDFAYLNVTSAAEGEAHGGAIMLYATPDVLKRIGEAVKE